VFSPVLRLNHTLSSIQPLIWFIPDHILLALNHQGTIGVVFAKSSIVFVAHSIADSIGHHHVVAAFLIKNRIKNNVVK
jgi:hypothetical protein